MWTGRLRCGPSRRCHPPSEKGWSASEVGQQFTLSTLRHFGYEVLPTPEKKARPAGFEPATLGSEDRCAIQLRHGRTPGRGSPPPAKPGHNAHPSDSLDLGQRPRPATPGHPATGGQRCKVPPPSRPPKVLPRRDGTGGLPKHARTGGSYFIRGKAWAPALSVLLERAENNERKVTSSELLLALQQEECRPPRNRRGNCVDWPG